ncbi:uncharacterized protein LOC116602136 [Nematostella vectensis]|uniref:uncharacterized protein LOC116602136 n=1 Tax=Nematostella vectensis TaxID=45351 RepID=UPI0020772E33|nr:uncharacterized protein LOC116602136 [Nematostella vectensis]
MLSSAGITGKKTFAWPLSPLVSMSLFFGPGQRFRTSYMKRLSTVVFVALFLAMGFVATLGVFVRTTIDTWIQFSLYIIPLISLIGGSYAYGSQAFSALLERKLGRRSPIRMFAEPDKSGQLFWHESQRGQWLRRSAYKNCIYPMSIEVYQWLAYGLFQKFTKNGDKFAGSWINEKEELFEIDDKTWLVLYVYFWVAAVYITGFVAYSFILVARLTTRDVISFMCRFGDGPFLPYKSTHYEFKESLYAKKPSFFNRSLILLIGFLTFDLQDTGKDIMLIHEQDTGTSTLNNQGVTAIEEQGVSNDDHDLDLDPEGNDIEESFGTVHVKFSSISLPRTPDITPLEACKCLTNLVANIEGLASAFQPFIILLTFFSVANFVTHIAAFIKEEGFQDKHWWTFTRTLLWLFLSIRLLWAVASITRFLSHLPLHVDYLRSIGKLQGEDKDWDGFMRLTNTFQLRTRTYGFPLTLKQVAYCATFLNFALLIVLSIIEPNHKHGV